MDEYEDFIDEHPDDDEDASSEEIEVVSAALKSKLRRLCEAREARDQAKTAWQTLKDDCERIELEVFDVFERTNAEGEPQIKGTLKIPLGDPWGTVAFRTRETFFAKIVDEEEVQEWYEKRAMMEEVSAPKFVMKRLNEDLRERLDQGQDPIPGTTFTASRGMTITSEK